MFVLIFFAVTRVEPNDCLNQGLASLGNEEETGRETDPTCVCLCLCVCVCVGGWRAVGDEWFRRDCNDGYLNESALVRGQSGYSFQFKPWANIR